MKRDHERTLPAVADEQLEAVCGARWKRNGVIPGYVAPEVYSDDGINVSTSDPSCSNVGYDSPFTPIPRPA
jgi:hypothetical protein